MAELLHRLDAQEARIRQLESQLAAPQRLPEVERPLPVAPPANFASMSALPPIEPAGPASAGADQYLRRLEAVEASLADISVTRTTDEAACEWEEVKQGWDTRWGGRIHWDWCNWASQLPSQAAIGGQNYQEFRRLRFVTQGTGYGVYEYKFEVEFAPEDTGTLQFGGVFLTDVYFGMRDIPLVNYARFGHSKVPWGLEWMESSNNLVFIERALPHVFSPMRDVGLSFYDYSDSERLTWAYGFFFDDDDSSRLETVDMNQGFTTSIRVTGLPYYEAGGRYLVHLGWSSRYTHDRDGTVRFRTRPEIHDGVSSSTFFDTGTLACKDYSTHVLEMAGMYGPVTLQSELYYANLAVAAGSANLYGAYAQVSWFLTGENRTYDTQQGCFVGLKPFTNVWFVPTCRGPCTGWGAWEVAARCSYLDATDIDQGQLTDFTAGLNWYLNPNMRLMFNYIHPFGNDAGGALGFDPEADIFIMRTQLVF